jgi:uncharacterized protein
MPRGRQAHPRYNQSGVSSLEVSVQSTFGGQPPALPKELFWREYSDPLSDSKFQAISVKSSAFNIRGRETDFGPIYDGINPLYYDIVITPSGLAAEDQVLKRSPKLLFKDRDSLVTMIRQIPEETIWLQPRNVERACLAFDRAFACAEFMKIPRSELASMAMKASWVYRELVEDGDETAKEKCFNYRGYALEKYLDAYENEDLSTLKVGYAGIAYLIGELMRERGQFDEGLRWLARVVTDRQVGGEVKRMARNQLDLCKEQRDKAKESGSYEAPEAERQKLRSMYQLFRDQARWLAKMSEQGDLNESDLLRGILDGVKNSGLDISKAGTEEKLAAYIAKKLQVE